MGINWNLFVSSKIYIKKILLNYELLCRTDFIINLLDIDTTDWNDVRTMPYRALTDAVKEIPKGMAFIREFMERPRAYIIES